ncbi:MULTISPECIES: hypothetical protein [Streptomycetaceae]|uniref:DUF4232 domain-containing protein n=1 Tax=Streptantibioticus cattleyicolor (strain ATCC 35852 / DSM 46488 / JCM 4925 / NBRC 14057 / NRRL 8057) TaxID=1003195 RepID=F8JZQ6_STREN|nr:MULTISPECIES: hypothetical protein [Streptomycetaceae]AEW94275.1 hypothetical protein SCATT_19040 [Streptantibioticus cattleyicolor NRRL 8057 = DSM 46488]MYS58932.1 hypothetical protein [Streptomyces sp. SID5468]CCB74632.1 exported protein of unknown function [Streptantibioticus cattleyicolor NRRL 8057 = DSM 46488]
MQLRTVRPAAALVPLAAVAAVIAGPAVALAATVPYAGPVPAAARGAGGAGATVGAAPRSGRTRGAGSASAVGRNDPHPDPAPPPDPAVTPPVCGDPAATEFPVVARLDGGPVAYVPGERARGFTLTLRNTTGDECREVHPVIVLVDAERKLTPGRIALEWRRPGGAGWQPVAFEGTEHAENVGLAGGENGPGLTVPAHATVTVPLRLRFTDGTAAPDRVVASATTMQRRGGGGAWVGESNHYAFDLVPPRPQLAATGRYSARILGLSCALVTTGVVLVTLFGRRRR